MSTRRKPIPPDAKKVFSGVIFEVYQWEQKMFDGSTTTFERLKRPNTAQVIAIAEGSIITQIEEQPDAAEAFPSIPGGRCDEGETPLESAKRELLEETGYASDDWQLWKEIDPVGKMEWTVYTFIARDCKKESEPHIDAGERIQTKLISLDEFIDMAEDPFFYSPELVADLLKMKLHPDQIEEFKRLLGI